MQTADDYKRLDRAVLVRASPSAALPSSESVRGSRCRGKTMLQLRGMLLLNEHCDDTYTAHEKAEARLNDFR